MGANRGNGRGGRLLPRDVLEPVAAAGAAFLTMAGVAALGLHLAGAGSLAPLHRLAAAVVALAVGGSVDLSGDLAAAGGGLLGGISMGLRGGVDLMPLGVTLAGAVVLAAVFLLPLRGRPALDATGLAVRAGAAVAASAVLLTILPLVGQGTIEVEGLPDSRGILGGGGGVPIGFHARPAPTVLGGLLWVVAVLAVGWLAARRTPLPAGWERLGRAVRPVVAATVTVVLGAVLVVTAGGLAVAGRQGGRQAAGAALLVAPNVAGGGLSLAVGVPWSGGVDLGGRAAGAVAAGQAPLPSGLTGTRVSLGSLPAGAALLLPAAAAVLVLLPCGVLAAAGARRSGGDGRSGSGRGRMRVAALRAGRLGVGLAVALPLLAALAGGSAHLGAAVLGMELLDAAASLRGDLPLAAVLGGLCGAAAGFLGSLLVDTLSRDRRAVSSDLEADVLGIT